MKDGKFTSEFFLTGLSIIGGVVLVALGKVEATKLFDLVMMYVGGRSGIKVASMFKK